MSGTVYIWNVWVVVHPGWERDFAKALVKYHNIYEGNKWDKASEKRIEKRKEELIQDVLELLDHAYLPKLSQHFYDHNKKFCAIIRCGSASETNFSTMAIEFIDETDNRLKEKLKKLDYLKR